MQNKSKLSRIIWKTKKSFRRLLEIYQNLKLYRKFFEDLNKTLENLSELFDMVVDIAKTFYDLYTILKDLDSSDIFDDYDFNSFNDILEGENLFIDSL